MNLLTIFGIAFLVVLAYVTTIWLLSLLKKDASIVDIFWGLGFVVLAWAYFSLADGFAARKLLIASLTTLWGLRLTLHILTRNWGKEEDFRYQAFRRRDGAAFWWKSFFNVFLLQGVLMWIISAPLLAAQFSSTPARLTWLDFVAVAVWLVGFFFEAVGDWQLVRFRANPANKGKVLDTGVWAWTRHPNYFGDAAQWWGFFLIALAAGGWWSIFGPLLMTGLLLKVSGVALLEKTLVKTKPQYREYVQNTSAFFPLPPRKKNP
jgi:steroid 5-alpha reductase family enzyme